MQEKPRVGAAQLQFAAVRLIEQDGLLATSAILLCRRSEPGGHEPASLLDKGGAGTNGEFVKRGGHGHDWTSTFSARATQPAFATAIILWASARNRHERFATSNRCT